MRETLESNEWRGRRLAAALILLIGAAAAWALLPSALPGISVSRPWVFSTTR